MSEATERAAHHCEIVPMSSEDRFRVECPACGRIGPVCDWYVDAEVIANRHEEIGGVER